MKLMRHPFTPSLRLAALAVAAMFVATGCRTEPTSASQGQPQPTVVKAAVAPVPVAATVPEAPLVPGPAQTPPQVVVTSTPQLVAAAPAPQPPATAPQPAPTAAAAAVAQAAPVTGAVAAPTSEPEAPPAPAIPQISTRVQELLKLAESGVEDSVLLAFVQNSPAAFNLTADEIVYLTDVGISDEVLTAAINYRGNPNAVAGIVPQTNQPPLEAATVAAPASTPVYTIVQEQPAQVVYVNQPEVSYFYTSLSPYGSWSDVPGYGYCWQPRVYAFNRGWRPYCERGRWIYTDCGWYWHSDYSWGWAPFHYGRWFCHGDRGWFWAPDRQWGPSWVSWRETSTHCGWAPLPPGSHYRAGVGLTFHSAGVGVGFGFGLHSRDYVFVPTGRFHDRAPWRHLTPRNDVPHIYSNSLVNNHYVQGPGQRIVNHGISRERVAAVSRTEIPKVTIRDQPPMVKGAPVRSEKIVREGNQLSIYRPAPVPVNYTSGGSRPLGSRPEAIRSNPVPGGGAGAVPVTSTRPQTPAMGAGRPAPVVSTPNSVPSRPTASGISPTRPERIGTPTQPQTLDRTASIPAQDNSRILNERAASQSRNVPSAQPARPASVPSIQTPATRPAPQTPVIAAPLVNNRPQTPATSRPLPAPQASAPQTPVGQNPIQGRPQPVPQYQPGRVPAMPAPATPSTPADQNPANRVLQERGSSYPSMSRPDFSRPAPSAPAGPVYTGPARNVPSVPNAGGGAQMPSTRQPQMSAPQINRPAPAAPAGGSVQSTPSRAPAAAPAQPQSSGNRQGSREEPRR